ncbi:tetraacyldisaccharide 4'-kinase [Microbaculum marinisediminis]|uniref:Tetraacyldisaccharide 4'-kinase n=1 Tax=Microbaculum marinisediminis TaxID=2931392 RepID=A0AAW5QQJ3_9HYPH|nr:tetraacyldisaccharide 4'-kinase [Microbaculum sp. A6E488]MCT8970356.1 tetraacyldisaccharide 4'-kinase [Microbaculum sp. A6E488]
MRAPGFWRGPGDGRRGPGWQALCLWPLSLIYALIAWLRFRRAPATTADVPVICIGNPTVGGSGKTPTAILIARLLAALGHKPVFLSRGYGARVAGPVSVDPAVHTAADVGDEPLLLARTAPTVVSPDRAAGARLAQTLGDIIVMDDGFQNAALAKDLSLLVIDGGYGIGNGYCLPAGPLRLPLDPQLARAAAVVVIGEGEAGEAVATLAGDKGMLVLRGRLAPAPAMTTALAGRPAIAFAGIGRPDKFFETVSAIGMQIMEARGFPDHHVYTEADARGLMALQKRSGAIPVTTEKDIVRIGAPKGGTLKALAEASVALPVTLALDEASALDLRTLLVGGLRRG